MAPQLMLTKGPLARGDRLCSSRAISSLPVPVSPVTSTEMSVPGHLLHLAKHLLHDRRGAQDLPEAHALDPLLQRLVVQLQLVHQQGVADQQRGLGGEDGEHLQAGLVEQLGDVVVAHVDDADQVAPLQQRHAHHRGQPQVHHRQRVAKLGVATERRETMSGFRVSITLARIESDRWLTASEMVSRRRLRATLTTGSPDSISTMKPLSALLTWMMTSISWSSRAPHLVLRHQLLRELEQLPVGVQLGHGLGGGVVGHRLVEQRELHLGDAQSDAVVLGQPVLVAPAPVDEAARRPSRWSRC